jgi:serine protease Do
VLASPGGLTTIGSPVFNAEGKAIGFVPYCQQGPPPWLNRNSGALQNLNAPPRLFVPAHDFLPSLKQPPTGQPLKIPWLGAVLAGLNKEVADYYNLKNVPVAQVGEVIPNSPAHKAGLKTGDKIVKVNAQPLERGDEPDETSAILIRKIRRMNVGDKVSLTVLREKDRPTTDLPITLEEQPKQANLAKRYYADDLGMTMREIVFSDTYAKKVPADTPGVVVAFVRQGSSANSAGLRAGDLVTQLNKEPIADLAGFKQQYKDFRQKDPKALVVLVVIREQKTEVIKIEPPQ